MGCDYSVRLEEGQRCPPGCDHNGGLLAQTGSMLINVALDVSWTRGRGRPGEMYQQITRDGRSTQNQSYSSKPQQIQIHLFGHIADPGDLC